VRIGVLGGGQLGLMLGEAGAPLGHTLVFLEPAEECPAATTGEWIRAPFGDAAALEDLALRSDLVTYEFENVPVGAVETIAARRPVFPSAKSLATAQDRLAEKRLFAGLGIPTPAFEAVDSGEDLAAAAARIGLPAVLKTRRMGYDGRGQQVLRERGDLAAAFATLGEQPLLLEAFVPFDREISVLAVRGRDGGVVTYPVIENHHRDGILRLSRAPAAGVSPGLEAAAHDHARRILEALDHVGVLALEMFQVGERLLASEIAPRVHNSGHWTIEGAATSQFENHLRAVTGSTLGATAARGHAAMVNLIGVIPDLAALAAIPGAHAHLYGKPPRPGRKLGHVTVCDRDAAALEQRLARVWSLVAAPAGPLPPGGGERPGVTHVG
jgi:5-(carboxyamino)imidazole ribonucleotide synthase